MTSSLFSTRCPINKHLLSAVLGSIAIMMSTLSLASEFEIARLATEIHSNAMSFSEQVADITGYKKLKLHSDRLSREAAKLAETIERGRNQAAVFAQFDTVFRRYTSLETAFLRASWQSQDQPLLDTIRIVASLYESLSYEIYFSGYDSNVSEVYFINSPFVTRHTTHPYYFPRDRLGSNLEAQ